ncbi:DUF6020 family protein [Brachybacterium kimchii]|uniref:DUF6020 family protein n=1 Tax=Brachybacterium kimchii TaxID=2942909 RepID=A0ABY4N0V0_9MICO|nr:DUF6020 family protein [Brachybacterium kimchii]UQN28131.1 DUF6020 family protein [Brachybacterium kimchii]
MERALRGVQKFGAVAVPILVVCALTVCATMGWIARHPFDDQGEHLLFLSAFDAHTKLVVGLLIYTAVMYAALLTVVGGLLRFTLARAEERAGEPTGSSRRPSRIARAARWLLGNWWRLALLLLVIWSPVLLGEVLGGGGAWADSDLRAGSLRGEGMSGHRSPLVIVAFECVLAIGRLLTGGIGAGLGVLVLVQLAVVLAALGRAAALLGRWVRSDGLCALALAVLVIGGVPIALWSLSLSPAAVGAASLCWFLALGLDHVHSREQIRGGRVLEWALAALLLLSCSALAVPLVIVMLVMAVIVRRGREAWRAALVALVVPLLVVLVGTRLGASQGMLGTEDPVAQHGLQAQSIALALGEDPDALSAEDTDALGKIFDVDALPDRYAPGAPARLLEAENDTVSAAQAEQLPSIWWHLAQNRPGLAADGILLEVADTFDPFAHGRQNLPGSADDGAPGAVGSVLDGTPGLRLLVESPLRVVAVLLLGVIAVALRRPGVWFWAVPIGVLTVALALMPADASGGAALVIGCFLPFALLALSASRELVEVGSPDGAVRRIRRVTRRRSAPGRGADGRATGRVDGAAGGGATGQADGRADGWDDGRGDGWGDAEGGVADARNGRAADSRAGGSADARADGREDSGAGDLSWIGVTSSPRDGGPQGRHQRSAEAEKEGRYGPVRSLPQRPLAPPKGLHRKPPRR